LNRSIKKYPGTTLLEMLVYTALLLMVFTGIFGVFIASVRYYYAANASIKVQQAALEATFRMGKELQESNLASVVLYSTNPVGVVFMSPRTSSGAISFNGAAGYEGELTWNSYICYYLTTDAEDSAKFQLVRKMVGVSAASDPVASAIYTPAYFATGGGSGIRGQTLAHRVESMDIYWMNGALKSYGTPTANPIYITLTTRQTNANGKDESVTTMDTIWAGN
jgi:hypothetical protein